MVRSTSIVREEEKNRYSCFMIFASLLLIHWLKPAHHSLSVLAFIQVQLYSKDRTDRNSNPDFFLCFGWFIPRYSATFNLTLFKPNLVINSKWLHDLVESNRFMQEVCVKPVSFIKHNSIHFSGDSHHRKWKKRLQKSSLNIGASSFSLTPTSDYLSTLGLFHCLQCLQSLP